MDAHHGAAAASPIKVAGRNPKTEPDYGPWPVEGFARVGLPKVRAALAGVSDVTVYRYIKLGILPAPERIASNRIAWRVDVIRPALEALPARLAEASRAARKGVTLCA